MKPTFLRTVAGVAIAVMAVCPVARAMGQHTAQAGVATSLRQPGTIVGTVWKHDNTPVPNGLLRLRDVASGRILMGTQADALGRFSFPVVPAGSYLLELVNERGDVLAVGQMFSLRLNETVATFIRLGARAPWYSGFFSNAAAAALVSAAALGVTAVGNGGQPASARS
jgi:hypothetical protein